MSILWFGVYITLKLLSKKKEKKSGPLLVFFISIHHAFFSGIKDVMLSKLRVDWLFV